ncbi:hypothetical protein CPB86DRAFT_829505 [Serendipita vermifera]|nr:hypothetical protein CPB86DRAFT_829505 [Serendipita vermifera]
MRVLATFLAVFLASTSVVYTAPVPAHIASSLTSQGHLPNSDVHHRFLPEAAHHEVDDEHTEHQHSKHHVAKNIHHHPRMVSNFPDTYKHDRRFWGAALLRGAKGAAKGAKNAAKGGNAKPSAPKRQPGYLTAFKNKTPTSNKPHGNTDWFKKKSPTKHKDDPKQEAACRADGVGNYWNCILYYAKKGEQKLRGGK